MAVQQLFGATAAANTTSGLTGSELVEVDNGGAVKQRATTGAIAALAGVVSTARSLTTLNTVGAGSLTAAALIGGQINRTGVQTGAFTDTTVSAATIIAALPSGAPVGTSWLLEISNNQTGAANYVETIAGGTGVTVSGITTVATGQTVEYLVTLATASTITMVGRSVAQSTSSSLNVAGATSGQTQIVPAATASGVLTLPAVTGVVAATPNTAQWQPDLYVCSAPQTANANITYADITGLVATVVPGTYRVRAILPSTVASGSGGIKYAFHYANSAALSALEITGRGFTASAVAVQHSTSTTDVADLFSQAAVVIFTELEGIIVVSAGGTIHLQMAQNTSNGSNSVTLVNAYFELTRIA